MYDSACGNLYNMECVSMKKPSQRTVRIIVISAVVLAVGLLVVAKRGGGPDTASARENPAADQAATASAPASQAVPATQEAKSSAAAESSPDAKRQAVIEGPLHLTASFDLDYYRSLGIPVILDFGASWCAPCKAMAPVLKELHESLEGRAIIRYVDVDKYRDLTEGYPVRVVPTQFLFAADGSPFVPDPSSPFQINQYSRKDSGEHVLSSHEGGLDRAQMLALLEAMGMQ